MLKVLTPNTCSGSCSQVNAIGHLFDDKSTLVQVIVLCHMTSLGKGSELTHCGRVTHICVSKLTIIDSDNGLSPGRRQAII